MNTVELTIEQVISGLAGLCVLLLPLATLLTPGDDAGNDTVLMAAVLVTAYTLGVVFDKVFDDALGGIEALDRLKKAIELRGKGLFDDRDRFPQGRIEAELRQRGQEGARTHLANLRIRIRIARTLGLASPALGAAACHAIWLEPAMSSLGLATALLPSAALAVPWIVARRLPRIPRTDEWPYDSNGLEPEDNRLLAWTPLGLAYGMAVLAWLPALARDSVPGALFVLAAAVLLGIVSVWTWRRIVQTYFTFLVDVAPFLRDEPETP